MVGGGGVFGFLVVPNGDSKGFDSDPPSPMTQNTTNITESVTAFSLTPENYNDYGCYLPRPLWDFLYEVQKYGESLNYPWWKTILSESPV